MPFGPPPSGFNPYPPRKPLAPFQAAAQPEPTAEELARKLEQERVDELKAVDAPLLRLVRCSDDATLFIARSGRAMTAWRWKLKGGRIGITYESGFLTWPSSGMWHREATSPPGCDPCPGTGDDDTGKGSE
jgi:hypothetical protein